jgi:hypothetical protein
MKVVILCVTAAFTYIFLVLISVRSYGHSAAVSIIAIKKFIDSTGYRTHYILAYNKVSQPTVPPRGESGYFLAMKMHKINPLTPELNPSA